MTGKTKSLNEMNTREIVDFIKKGNQVFFLGERIVLDGDDLLETFSCPHYEIEESIENGFGGLSLTPKKEQN